MLQIADLDVTPLLWIAVFFVVLGLVKVISRNWEVTLVEEKDVEQRLKAISYYHWRYCPKCGRWYLGMGVLCMGHAFPIGLRQPPKEDAIAFMGRLLPFWQGLVAEAGENYSENEVAGLLWTKERASTDSSSFSERLP